MAFLSIELGSAIAAIIITIIVTLLTMKQARYRALERRQVSEELQDFLSSKVSKFPKKEEKEKPPIKPITNEDLMAELKRFEENISREDI